MPARTHRARALRYPDTNSSHTQPPPRQHPNQRLGDRLQCLLIAVPASHLPNRIGVGVPVQQPY